MMMIRALLVLGVCCLALAGCEQVGITSAATGHTAANPGVFTNRPYTQAETEADNSGKVFLVDATAAWCGPCKIMDRTTWKDPRVVSWISDNAVAVQVDVDRHPKLARQLRIVAAMIRDEMTTRVYYVTLGGFDTHANQYNQHANLMRQLGDALNAFYKDLKTQGSSGRVLTMVFSEFGRRVGQNASGGTDHGTAAPMYFVGDMVRPGLLGDHPSLTDLDQGDLKFTVDVRSVYTAVLEDWMGAPAAKVLGRRFRKARILEA